MQLTPHFYNGNFYNGKRFQKKREYLFSRLSCAFSWKNPGVCNSEVAILSYKCRPKSVSNKEWCPKTTRQARMSRQECRTVTQGLSTRVCFEHVAQECLTRMLHKCQATSPTRVSNKRVKQRVSHKNVLECKNDLARPLC